MSKLSLMQIHNLRIAFLGNSIMSINPLRTHEIGGGPGKVVKNFSSTQMRNILWTSHRIKGWLDEPTFGVSCDFKRSSSQQWKVVCTDKKFGDIWNSQFFFGLTVYYIFIYKVSVKYCILTRSFFFVSSKIVSILGTFLFCRFM